MLLALIVLLIGLVSNDLRVNYITEQTQQGARSKLEFLTSWRGVQLKVGLTEGGPLLEASWVVLVPRLIPLRFEIDGLKGELKVKRGQRIKKGQVIAVRDARLLEKLERELPTLDPELKQEAQEKIEELLIRAAVEGVVHQIVIEAVDGETVGFRLDVNVKSPIYSK